MPRLSPSELRLERAIREALGADVLDAYIFELRVERVLPIPDEYRPQFHTPRQPTSS